MKKINTIFNAILLIIIGFSLVGCDKEKIDIPIKKSDVIDLELTGDGSTFKFKSLNNGKPLMFQPCGKGYKEQCPSDELGKENLIGVQNIKVFSFEKQINSVKCCIQINIPGNSIKYCDTFPNLNKCPFGKPS